MPEGDTTETTETTTVETREAPDQETPDNLLKALKAEREARKALEKELKPLKTWKQEQEQAKLTEAERLQARIKELEGKEHDLTRKERTLAVRDGLQAAAADQKLSLVASSATVIRLLNLDAVEFDEAGNPQNLGSLLKQLAKDEPALFTQQRRTGSADGGATGQGIGQDMNALLRRAAGRG